MKGLTFYICIGKPTWPLIEWGHGIYRLVIGPISFGVMPCDWERFAAIVVKAKKIHSMIQKFPDSTPSTSEVRGE